jgi:hypothetical protein
MNIKLNDKLKNDLKNRYIKTIDIVNFLISKGFNTNLKLENTSLNKLSLNGNFIKSAKFDNNNLILKF